MPSDESKTGRKVVKPGMDVVASMAEDFKKDLLEAVSEGPEVLVIDLTGANMVDSVGIGLLVATHNSMSRAGGKLEVTNASEELAKLFQTMRLDQHFRVTLQSC